MKKNLRLSLLIFSGILLVLFAYIWPTKNARFYQDLKKATDHSFAEFELAGQKYRFEIVNQTASITQGLSDRLEIGSDGMLFVTPAKAFYSFWMPRMNFNLDILWFNDGELVQIMSNVPREPATKPDFLLPLYVNEKKANLVLELPAGQATKSGLKIGDRLSLLN